MGGGRRHDKGNKPVPKDKPFGFKRWKSAGPRDALLRQRRGEAMQLRASGMPLEMIGQALHADPAINADGQSHPLGYGWKNYSEGKPPLTGGGLTSAVSRDISEAMQNAELASEQQRQESLELALYKLDMASSAIWPRVLQGRERSLEVWLKLEERRAKLLGLDKAEKIEHSGETTVRLVEGEHPVYDRDFASSMFSALREVGIEAPKELVADLDSELGLASTEQIEDAEVIDAAEVEVERTASED